MRLRSYADQIVEYFNSYWRLVWALIGLATGLLGITVLPQVCIWANVIFDGSMSCIQQAALPTGSAYLISLILILLGLVVWYIGRKLEIEEKQAEAEQILNQKELNKANVITREDRAIGGREVVDQIPFSVPTINTGDLSNLRDLVDMLREYSSRNLGAEFRQDEVYLHDKSYQTIFSIGNTRFSTFIAVISEQGAILMLDRAKNKHVTTVNDQLDVFGSVGYENKSIQSKLFDALNRKELKVMEYVAIPGVAIENIRFNNSDKYEVAVMIGHLAVVRHSDFEKISKSAVAKSKELVIISSIDAIDNRALTSKAELALNYIRTSQRNYAHNDA